MIEKCLNEGEIYSKQIWSSTQLHTAQPRKTSCWKTVQIKMNTAHL